MSDFLKKTWRRGLAIGDIVEVVMPSGKTKLLQIVEQDAEAIAVRALAKVGGVSGFSIIRFSRESGESIDYRGAAIRRPSRRVR